MSIYYSRYKSGECEAVFKELVNPSIDLTQPSLRAAAEDVAKELVDRSFTNILTLFNRLKELGYLFENSEEVVLEATELDLVALDNLELSCGVLPIVARKWYERISSVNFTQQSKQLFSKDGSPCSAVSGLGLNAPLVFLSVPRCLVLQEQLYNDAVTDGEDPRRWKHFLPLGGWGSNSNPKGFWLPCHSFDAEFYNDGAGPVSFVEELRTAFRWGGFPFWRRLLAGRSQAQPVRCIPSFEAILPALTEGILPI